jgi:pimeloyl-ACP methyl ester carboxylesterase
MVNRVSCNDGTSIAYTKIEGKNPGLIFVHGLHSDQNGTKALMLEEFARSKNLAFIRFDVFGHGQSDGDFEDGTIGRWFNDLLVIIDNLTQGPQIIIGSSMGGWLMFLAAQLRKTRIVALLGLAAAPDFTKDILENLTQSQALSLHNDDKIELPDCDGGPPIILRKTFLEEGKKHYLLNHSILLDCPVYLIQGQKDREVPWSTALKIAEKISHDKVTITFLKSAEHRLSRKQDLTVIGLFLTQILDDLASH